MKSNEIIRDENQLELPDYIDQPKFVRNKSVGYGLVFLGWFLWIWLFIPLLTFLLWVFETFVIYRQITTYSAENSPMSIALIFLLIAFCISGLILWACYNWFRFHNVERRIAPESLTTSDVAKDFKITEETVTQLKHAKNITLHYDGIGNFIKHEINHT